MSYEPSVYRESRPRRKVYVLALDDEISNCDSCNFEITPGSRYIVLEPMDGLSIVIHEECEP